MGICLLLIVIIFIIIIRLKKQLYADKDNSGESLKFRERYTDFVHLLPQTVIELDVKGRIVFLNKAGYDFLGLNKYDIDKGVFISDMIVEEQRSRFKQELNYVIEGGLNKGQEFVIETKQGERPSIIIYFSPIVNVNEHVGIRGIIIDVSESKRLERKAFRAVVETEERERKRYSEDLHDGLGPLLSTIKLYINQMNKQDASEKERIEMLGFSNDLIDEAISTTRTIANNILPSSIGDNGLWAAVIAFCNHIEQTGVIKFSLSNNTKLRFRKKASNNIYRILIELINNSMKHAQARRISISFEKVNDMLLLIYSDDGKGIGESKNKGLGLSNIKNRSHSLNGQYKFINSGGMRFELLLPLNEIVENVNK